MRRTGCILTAFACLTLATQAMGQNEKRSPQGAADLVREGQVSYDTYTASGVARAAEFAKRAVVLNPNYGPGWTLLAATQIASNPVEAKANALKGVTLQPSSDGWTILARAQVATREFSDAEKSFRRALELDSTNSDAYGYYGYLLADLGRYEESLQVERKATATSWIDGPMRPLWGLGRHDEVMRIARNGIAAHPDDTSNLFNQFLGYALLERGQHAAALAAIARQRQLREAPAWTDAWVYVKAGQPAKGREILKQSLAVSNPPQGQQLAIAALYANLGVPDSAFLWLDRANARGGMTTLRWHPQWAPIRSDPRFKQLLRKVGLEK